MYLFHLSNFHNKKNTRDMDFQSRHYDCDLNNFLYGFWNGPIIYDVLVKDLILAR
jgi:hypothetical protein